MDSEDPVVASQSGRPVCEVLSDLILALRRSAEFDAYAILLTDPDSMLPFGGLASGLCVDSAVPFWDNELLDPDFVKFNDLARSTDPVASLHEATDGQLSRSPRFRMLYEPMGASDELRIAFRSGDRCWAVACLVRPGPLGPFTPTELEAVRKIAPIAADSIRCAVTRQDCDQIVAGPAMLVVAADGRIESATTNAEPILVDLQTQGLEDLPTPTVVIAVARRAMNSCSGKSVSVRARGASGRWLKIHAASLGSDGRVGVIIEAPRPADLLPIFVESYGLTPREVSVVRLLIRGISINEVASDLHLSRHTVHDHIKVIYHKCGVTSRSELVANLFTQNVVEEGNLPEGSSLGARKGIPAFPTAR